MRIKKNKAKLSGYTLVELSIVLVIISLLIGGALAGKSLVQSAKLKSTMDEVTELTNAFHAFQEQYKSLPGDMMNATDFWGAADGAGGGNSPACMDAYTDGIETCNGNDSGSITPVNVYIDNTYEHLRAIQHMKNAGFISGEYSGTLDPDVGLKAGFNSPPSALNAGMYTIHYFTLGANRKGTAIDISKGGSIMGTNVVATPKDAYAIDSKYDDGNPDTGIVFIVDIYGDCADSGNYRLSDETLQCVLNYWAEMN